MSKIDEIVNLVLETLDSAVGVEDVSKSDYLAILEELYSSIQDRREVIQQELEDDLE